MKKLTEVEKCLVASGANLEGADRLRKRARVLGKIIMDAIDKEAAKGESAGEPYSDSEVLAALCETLKEFGEGVAEYQGVPRVLQAVLAKAAAPSFFDWQQVFPLTGAAFKCSAVASCLLTLVVANSSTVYPEKGESDG